MKKVSPELDGLMWTLAEQANERAIDEFGARHPELRGELVRRIAMVRALRSANRPISDLKPSIPRFVPTEPRGTIIRARGPAIAVGSLVLAAVAAAAFTITTVLSRPNSARPTVAYHSPVEPPKATIKEESAPTQPIPPVETGQGGVVYGNHSEVAPPPDRNVALDPNKKISIRIEESPIATVLASIATISGLRIEPSDDLPNTNVAVDYEDMAPREMLKDLGKRYAFTIVDEQDGSILVMPSDGRSGVQINAGDANGMRNRKIGG